MSSLLERINSRLGCSADPVIQFRGQTITAGALSRQVASASELLAEAGVVEGARVGLAMPPSPAFLVAMIASWRRGASFVPLPVDSAKGRIDAMLRDAGIKVVLGHDDEGQSCRLESVTVDTATRAADFRDEAYVIFTSGSTGKPRGVSVSHRAIATYVSEALHHLGLPETGVEFVFHLPPSFDAHLTSTLLPLATQNSVVPLAPVPSSTIALADYLASATSPVVIKTTPSQVRLLQYEPTLSSVPATFVIGGEQLYHEDVHWLLDRPGVRVFNEYGPTEATVGCSYHEVVEHGSGPVPIGLPHGAATFRIQRGSALADGSQEGELTIAGQVVANGYLGGDGERRFFLDPSGIPAYRTGDIVRRGVDGVFWFVGRADDQVKIDGYRVELGEIDAALRAAYETQAASVLTPEGIVGFVTRSPRPKESRVRLAALLPSYMRPIAVHSISEIPSTRHGKVDRARLLESHIANP